MLLHKKRLCLGFGLGFIFFGKYWFNIDWNERMSIFNYMMSKIYKEKKEPEELLKEPSGCINIQYDSETGDFHVFCDINDVSAESSEILSLLLFHISNGELEPFVYESLKLWAGEDREKKAFNLMLAEDIKKINSLILDIETTAEETDDVKGNKVAVKASRVFNFRDMK